LKVEFLGGASEVGRSAILLKGNKSILMDYGVKIDHLNKNVYPIPTGIVDAFILSHAHLDHCGFAPALYMNGNPVAFGTSPTLDLSQLLIEDSMKIERKEHGTQKFYKRQAAAFSNNYVNMQYGKTTDFGGYDITFYDAGHIPGSAITLLQNEKTERRLVYTGDFKLEPQMMHLGGAIVKTDTLIIESTYATREHPDREDLIKKFVDEIREVVDSGGTALMPCFAVGRAQELLMILQKNNLMDNTFLDGMAKKATEIILENKKYINNADLLSEAVENAVMVQSSNQRKSAAKGSSIIVTTAGMLNGGPIINYLTKVNNRSKIFLTGYQVEGTNGRLLSEGKPINIDGRKTRIELPLSSYDFSAHAGRKDIFRYVRESNPEKVICVHGDIESVSTLKNELKEEGFDAYAPKVGDNIEVDI
jgi:putative mRNA 3-end processing factor